MYNPLLSRGDDYYIRSYIKGIGSTLLGTFAPEQIFDGVGVLFNCFYSRGEYLFGSYEPRCVNIYHKFPLGTETIQELEGLQITQHTGDGNFVFELKNKGKYGCKIYNAQGAMLSNPLVNQGSNHVSLVDFPKGMYFIQVYELESQRQKTLKMLWQ